MKVWFWLGGATALAAVGISAGPHWLTGTALVLAAAAYICLGWVCSRWWVPAVAAATYAVVGVNLARLVDKTFGFDETATKGDGYYDPVFLVILAPLPGVLIATAMASRWFIAQR